MTPKMAECRVKPEKVYEMREGDVVWAAPNALIVGRNRDVYLRTAASVFHRLARGMLKITCDSEGLHVDISTVAVGRQWERQGIYCGVKRVASLSGVICTD